MQHLLPYAPIHHAFYLHLEEALAWTAALLLSAATYPLFIKLVVFLMDLLYGMFIQYQN